MIKLIGFIIILLSASKIGYEISEGYKNRTREIRSVITALSVLKNEISFKNCVLSDAFYYSSRVKNPFVSCMFKTISEELNKSTDSLIKIYESYILKNKDKHSLSNNDTEILYDMFSKLGYGDTEEQINIISYAIRTFESNLKSSVENERKYVRLFRTGGVLAGILTAIIFI